MGSSQSTDNQGASMIEKAKRIDRKRQQLCQSYNNWLKHSSKAIDSISETRDKIISKINCISIAGTVGGLLGIFTTMIGIGIICFIGGMTQIATAMIFLIVGAAVYLSSNIKIITETEILCKTIIAKLEEYNEKTALFESECKSYFNALDDFNCIIDAMGEDVIHPLLQQVTEKAPLEFLGDLELDKHSRNQVLFLLNTVIAYDIRQLVHQTWSFEFAMSASNKLNNLEMEVRMMHKNLRNSRIDIMQEMSKHFGWQCSVL